MDPPVNNEKPDSLNLIHGEASVKKDANRVSDSTYENFEKTTEKIDRNLVQEITTGMTNTDIVHGTTGMNFTYNKRLENSFHDNIEDENLINTETHEGFVAYGNTDEVIVHKNTDENFAHGNTNETNVYEDTYEDIIENESIKVEANDMVMMTGTSLLNLYKEQYAASQDRKDSIDLIDSESKVTSKNKLIEQNDDNIEVLEADIKCENLSSDNVKSENIFGLGNSSDVDTYKLNHPNNEIRSFLDERGSALSTLDCNVCHKKFARRQNLKEHFRFVHELPTLECNVCHKKFARRKNLKEHIRFVHEKEKSFLCNYCNKRFARNISLMNHIADIHE